MSFIYKKIIPFVIYQKYKNENIIVVSLECLHLTLNVLKKHFSFRFNLLSYIAGVDLYNFKYRFCVVYDLLSITYNSRLRVKIFLNEATPAISVINIFINSNWWEREVWDMFGIFFYNHPDLRRILTDYGFEGFPLRKDFPLMGYYEARYDENLKRVVYPKVELAQEYRQFDIINPWIVLNKNFNQNSIVYTN